MQARNQETIESLNQRASEDYNHGRFAEALSTWRQLLLLDPQNASALEGVRMCEMLTDGNAAPPQVPSAGEADLMGDLDRVDALLDETPSPPAAAAAAPIEFDLSALDDTPSAPTGSTASPVPPDGSSSPTDVELQIRVNELYQDALRVFSGGDSQSAMIILSRLFILDEDNEQAEALREQIRATLEPQAEEVEDEEQLLAEIVPVAPPATPNLDLPEQMRDGTVDEIDEHDVYGDAEENDKPQFGTEWKPPAETGSEEESVPEAAPPGVLSKLPGGKVVWGVGLLVLVLLIGGKMFLGGGSATPETEAVAGPVTAQTTPPPNTKPAPAPTPVATNVVTAPKPLSPAEKAARIETLSAQGQAALISENYNEAVAAYTEVVKLDPTRTDAIERLEYAAAQSRLQAVISEKWQEGISAWNDGRYRQALAAFYRLPESVDQTRLDRYKLNGWYNMGVTALQSSDCARARDHFNEARTIAAQDPGVLEGLQLVHECSAGGGVAFSAKLSQMPLKGLED